MDLNEPNYQVPSTHCYWANFMSVVSFLQVFHCFFPLEHLISLFPFGLVTGSKVLLSEGLKLPPFTLNNSDYSVRFLLHRFCIILCGRAPTVRRVRRERPYKESLCFICAICLFWTHRIERNRRRSREKYGPTKDTLCFIPCSFILSLPFPFFF